MCILIISSVNKLIIYNIEDLSLINIIDIPYTILNFQFNIQYNKIVIFSNKKINIYNIFFENNIYKLLKLKTLYTDNIIINLGFNVQLNEIYYTETLSKKLYILNYTNDDDNQKIIEFDSIIIEIKFDNEFLIVSTRTSIDIFDINNLNYIKTIDIDDDIDLILAIDYDYENKYLIVSNGINNQLRKSKIEMYNLENNEKMYTYEYSNSESILNISYNLNTFDKISMLTTQGNLKFLDSELNLLHINYESIHKIQYISPPYKSIFFNNKNYYLLNGKILCCLNLSNMTQQILEFPDNINDFNISTKNDDMLW